VTARRGRAGRIARRGAVLAVVLLLLSVTIVLGASPEPSPAGAGDTRSAGEGPGLVGAPLLAIGGVVAIGAASLLATLGYVRLTGGPRDRETRP
jgi:hypothetical protein